MSIATDSLRTYIFRIATMVNGFIMGILTARFLGPAGKGDYALALMISSLYTSALGILNGAITYRMTRLKEDPKASLITASVYGWIVGFVTILGFWLYTRINPHFSLNYLWLVALNAPLVLAFTNLSGFFMGLNRITTTNWLGLASGLVLTLFLALGFLIWHIDMYKALMCWLIAQLLVVIWGFWISRSYWLPPWHDSFRPLLLKQMLGFGWQLGLVNLVTYLNYTIDMFLVRSYLGNTKLGFYSIAVATAQLLWFTSGSIGTAIIARIGMAEHDDAVQLTAKAVRHTLFLNVLTAIVLWAGVELFLPLIYGEIYRPSLVPFRILLPGVLAFGLAGIFSTYFSNQLGKPKFSLLISALSMVINIVICVIFIPRIGMAGGAWGTTVSYIVSVGVLIGFFGRKTKISLKELFFLTPADWTDYRNLLQKVFRHFN